MEWMEKLRNGLERAEGIQVLASVRSEAMLFLDHLKQHLIQNPEPVFAVPLMLLGRTAPALLECRFWIVSGYAAHPQVGWATQYKHVHRDLLKCVNCDVVLSTRTAT
jgi:hypothetical protein